MYTVTLWTNFCDPTLLMQMYIDAYELMLFRSQCRMKAVALDEDQSMSFSGSLTNVKTIADNSCKLKASRLSRRSNGLVIQSYLGYISDSE